MTDRILYNFLRKLYGEHLVSICYDSVYKTVILQFDDQLYMPPLPNKYLTDVKWSNKLKQYPKNPPEKRAKNRVTKRKLYTENCNGYKDKEKARTLKYYYDKKKLKQENDR